MNKRNKMKTPQEKRRFWHNLLSSVMNSSFGIALGYASAHYNLLILLLAIPYAFQTAFAIIFKHEKK